MVERLSTLDSSFLYLEEPGTPMHVGGVLILERPAGGVEALADLIAARLSLVPRYRQRVAEVPGHLANPVWVDDPDFDLEYHVRELALPQPATEAKLGEQIARIASRPLDRSRPLWELYLIHGLPDGNVALLTKIHHAAVDGMSGAEILGVLLDLTADGREAPPPQNGSADPEPTDLEMLARGVVAWPRYFGRVLRAVPRVVPNIEDSPFLAQIPGASAFGRSTARVARAARREPPRVLERSTIDPPRTSFNAHVSAHRRFAFGRLPLDDAKAVKSATGSTLNDVIMSVCAGALRRWLIDHGELPDGPLVAQIPVSVRTEAQRGTFGNRVGVMSPPLYTDEGDPLRRLALTHESMINAKEIHKATPASLMQDSSEFIPPAVFARATRVTMSLAATRKPIWNLVISNVPGPQVPLYFDGAEVKALFPVSVIADGMGLNITVFSYCGSLDFGIVADRELMPDVWNLIDYLRDSLAEHKDAI
jgi:WS/DGAT/MGAT family acyltransferase